MKKVLSCIILSSFIIFTFRSGLPAHAAFNPNEQAQFLKIYDHEKKYTKNTYPGMKDGYLDFSGSKWSLEKDTEGRRQIVQRWGNGYEAVFQPSKIYVGESKNTEGIVTYKRTFDYPDRGLKFVKPDNEVLLRVFRYKEDPHFAIVAEEVSTDIINIMGIYWVVEDFQTLKTACENDSEGKVKSSIFEPISSPIFFDYGPNKTSYPRNTLGKFWGSNRYEGDIQGDSEGKAGLCAYDPRRLTLDRWDEVPAELKYYIFNLNKYLGDKGTPFKISYTGSSIKPTQGKIDECSSNKSNPETYLNKPLSSYNDSGHQKIFETIKYSLLQGLDDDAKGPVKEILNEPDIITKSEDDILYRQYYRSSDSINYPDREVDQEMVDNFNDLIFSTQVAKKLAEANDKDKDSIENWKTTVSLAGGAVISGSFFAKVGRDALGFAANAIAASAETAKTVSGQAIVQASVYEASKLGDVAKAAEAGETSKLIASGWRESNLIVNNGTKLLIPPTVTPEAEKAMATAATGGRFARALSWIGPVILITAAVMLAYFVFVMWKQSKAKESVKELIKGLIKLELAAHYIECNRIYRECANIWTDQQEGFFQQIQISKDKAVAEGKDALNSIYKDICPKAQVTNIPSWFQASLCGLGMALWEAGQSLMKFASQQFEQVLGIKYGLGY